METNDDMNNRRRDSLSISALLNEDAVDPMSVKRKSTSSSEGRSSSTSPKTNKSPDMPKAKRKRISPQQYNRLMHIFDQTDTPSSEIRENLAEELGMTKREVQVWFQNRRAKVNRSKNLVNSRHRQHHQQVNTAPTRSRRLSIVVDPSYENRHFYPPPIAPTIINNTPYPHIHKQQHKPPPPPSRSIDVLASAVEYLTREKS